MSNVNSMTDAAVCRGICAVLCTAGRRRCAPAAWQLCVGISYGLAISRLSMVCRGSNLQVCAAHEPKTSRGQSREPGFTWEDHVLGHLVTPAIQWRSGDGLATARKVTLGQHTRMTLKFDLMELCWCMKSAQTRAQSAGGPPPRTVCRSVASQLAAACCLWCCRNHTESIRLGGLHGARAHLTSSADHTWQ